MRRFTSYGPVNPKKHYCVERRGLVENCVAQLVGDEEEGHYFTIWAPRQSGKTWLMRRAIEEIKRCYSERFIIGSLSMQGVVMKKNEPPEAFLERVPDLMERGFQRSVEKPSTWEAWAQLFRSNRNVFDRKVILLIDEVDKLRRDVIALLVGLFRDMYLDRDNYLLHGLALIGVRAVLGAESDSGSPFNVQRSLKVDNLTEPEVNEMFDQYEVESGQSVVPEVRSKVFQATRGQPGLVSWFGELLTEKYNPKAGVPASVSSASRESGDRPAGGQISGGQRDRTNPPIAVETWETLYPRAVRAEWNNNVLNLLSKARERESEVLGLFANADVPFSIHQEWCNFLYLNGVIDYDDPNKLPHATGLFCRFASPFVQECLYTALTDDIFGARGPILALEPGDLLEDIFGSDTLNLPALLQRYKAYLDRLSKRGIVPWKGQPRRKTDLNLTESIGHFHLYAWLRDAIGMRTVIAPEFPTGNGKVDLVVHQDGRLGIIEVKSFRDSYELRRSYERTAEYARNLGLDAVTMAVFVPAHDETVLEKVSGTVMVGQVQLNVVAIGWG